MSNGKQVLVLGAGFVSGPVVEHLTRDPGIRVTVASVVPEQAEELATHYRNTVPIVLDVTSQENCLDSLIREHNLVISLLPAVLHPLIAEHCINNRVNMLTPSYVSPAMKELHKSAEEAGITILNEMGLDPGIDHMLAMECIDQAKADGCTVESYISYCGGLPAPECSDNLLHYKISWNPIGSLLIIVRPAVYQQDGQVIHIPKGESLLDSATPVDVFPGLDLEFFPNGNSMQYAEAYGIETAHTHIRGTLRYSGFSRAASSFVKLGMISQEPLPAPDFPNSSLSWKELICHLTGLPPSASMDSVHQAVCDRIGYDEVKLETLKWLGILGEEPVPSSDTVLEAFAKTLEAKLSFKKGEYDMVLLITEVGIRHSTGDHETKRNSLLVYGDPSGFSAMAKTVGYPIAIAARMLLYGEIVRRGVVVPLTKDIYIPVLKRLQEEGICPQRECRLSKPSST